MLLNIFLVFNFVLKQCFANIKDVDVCQNENFHPTCPKYESIFIESSKYGRMRGGKCFEIDEKLENDPRWLGCEVDVTDITRLKCSGRYECDVAVKDRELGVTNHPCYKGLLMSLNVRYRCLPVLLSTPSCSILLTSNSKSFLIPLQTSQSSLDKCGSTIQPWLFEAPQGQKIKINAKLVLPKLSESLLDKCLQGGEEGHNYHVGYFYDHDSKHEDMCLNEILESTFESKRHLINLVLANSRHFNKNDSFLLVEAMATGCLDLIPAEDAWLKRNDDLATIGCYSSRQTWILKCVGNQWIGVVGNCSMGKVIYSSPEDHVRLKSEDENNQILSLVMISGFGLALCMIIVCCGVFCVKRISRNYKKSIEGFQPYQQHSLATSSGKNVSNFGNNNYNLTYNLKNDHDNDQNPAYYVLSEDAPTIQNAI